jgi:hypothetical protein
MALITKIKKISRLDDDNDYALRVFTAAKMLHSPEWYVYRLIKRGELEARYRTGKGTFVSRKSLLTFIDLKDVCVGAKKSDV